MNDAECLENEILMVEVKVCLFRQVGKAKERTKRHEKKMKINIHITKPLLSQKQIKAYATSLYLLCQILLLKTY